MIALALIGLLAGALSGLFGVGGGILFVPALTLVGGLSQVHAEATSLLAIVPVAALGTWRQHRYGNLRPRDALLVGALSAGGAVGGVALANVLPDRTLELGFAVLMLLVAAQLARQALLSDDGEAEGAGR